MKRLTIRGPEGSCGIPGIDILELDDRVVACISRLAEYEDTKLTPADVEKLKLPWDNDIYDLLNY